ncbi:MAG: hypothetical protein NVS4B7_15830 [Ktedonobacteraceae bacterium]
MSFDILKGMATTFKNMGKKPTTISYPEQERELPPRFRGRHVLHRYDNSLERCVGCYLCAGAIMVLFLFVVTMLASEADDTELQDRIPWQRWIGGLLGLTLVGALSYLLFTGAAIDSGAKATGANSLSHAVNTQGNIEAFGLALFHGFAFPFEVTSLLIIVAILGALVLGRKA